MQRLADVDVLEYFQEELMWILELKASHTRYALHEENEHKTILKTRIHLDENLDENIAQAMAWLAGVLPTPLHQPLL